MGWRVSYNSQKTHPCLLSLVKMESLKGKTALVTGAGKGLGKALSLALATEGVNLMLLSRTKEDLITVATEASKINIGIQTAFKVADTADFTSVTSAISDLTKTLGPIDILINNAGIGKFGNFMTLSVEEWEDVIRTNLLGPYYCIHEVLPGMIERKNGDIVNVSSTAGLRGSPLTSAYSASKFGLIGLSESLMLEARKSGVRVFTATPSTIATPLAIGTGLTDGDPKKVLQPEDFAEMIVAHLKLPRRALVKDVSLWSTNS
jgi:3-oxoacyl-[acyl-carrier protein] reductase